MINLKNKSVLITGGSGGIGKACVRLFSDVGASVGFTFKTGKNSADELVEELSNKSKVKAFKADLMNEVEIKNTVSSFEDQFGKIDILVNNAGIWKEAEVSKMTIDEWEETLKINLTAAFLFTKYAVPGMKKNKSGKIINISSTAGQRGEAYHSHYAASKGGIISFTKSLAAELGEYNINVNCVAPGWVITDMTKESLNDKLIFEKVCNDIPLKKIAVPEDVAGPVLFLASELASHVTGEILNVNGGSVLCG
ncbi:MAG: 3-oxoacyl-ACP reductase FabG [Ignavibacteriae bacterium]|nr:MAG: 3-oxoacyl-ACP reductase FabG [Ignavibacteriota bacterium]